MEFLLGPLGTSEVGMFLLGTTYVWSIRMLVSNVGQPHLFPLMQLRTAFFFFLSQGYYLAFCHRIDVLI